MSWMRMAVGASSSMSSSECWRPSIFSVVSPPAANSSIILIAMAPEASRTRNSCAVFFQKSSTWMISLSAAWRRVRTRSLPAKYNKFNDESALYGKSTLAQMRSLWHAKCLFGRSTMRVCRIQKQSDRLVVVTIIGFRFLHETCQRKNLRFQWHEDLLQ